MNPRTILTCTIAALLCAPIPSTHASDPPKPIQIATKLVYPDGKPAIDAVAVLDLINLKTKAITTTTSKPDATGLIIITIERSNFALYSHVLFVSSPTGIGFIQWGTPARPSTSTVEPFTALRVQVVDDAGKPIPNERLFPTQFGSIYAYAYWNPAIPRMWTQTTDANGYATLTKLPQGCKISLDVIDDHYAQPDKDSDIQLDNTPAATNATLHLTAALSISGTVQLASPSASSNKSLAGILIEASSPIDPMQTFSALTDNTGAFTLARLAPGTYLVAAADQRGTTTDWIDKARSVQLAPAERKTGLVITLIHGGLITGKITDKVTGKPASNIYIRATQTNASGGYGASTDKDGTYSVRVLPGAYKVSIQDVYSGISNASTTPDTVIAEGQTKSIDFQIDAPTVVQGTLLQPNGKPVSGVDVMTMDFSQFPNTVKTDSLGKFTFDSPGLEKNARILARSGQLTVDYVFDGDSPITLRLSAGNQSTVKGQIVDKNNTPVPNAPVDLIIWGEKFGIFVDHTHTDAQGQYVFASAIGNAKYNVETSPPGYTQENSPTLEVAAGQTLQIPVIMITATTSSLGGTLLDVKGTPISNATISDNRRPDVKTTTDKSGHFLLKGLEAGRVGLTIQTDDGRSDYPQMDSGRTDYTIYMPSPVNVLVLGPDNKPIAGAKITIPEQEYAAQTVTTDESGEYTINTPGLKAKTALVARSGDLATSAPVVYNGEDQITLHLTPGHLCTISGEVRNTDGGAVPNATVMLFRDATDVSGEMEDTTSDAQGHYTFDPIFNNSKYVVLANAQGYARNRSDDFTAGTTQTVQAPPVTITMTDAFAAGTVVDAKGNPVFAATVTDQDADNNSATTDQSGHFMLKGVPRGKTEVYVQGPAGATANQRITSNRGDNLIYLSKPK